MIKFGKVNIDITLDFNSINFSEPFACYTQTDKTKLHYTPHNSSIQQVFEDTPSWLGELQDQLPHKFDNIFPSIIKINPGNTVPYHVDKHYKLKEKYGDGESYRFVIFLEDWDKGHYFEIHNRPYTLWSKGDWVMFGIDDWHLAGNMGEDPFYVGKITGIC